MAKTKTKKKTKTTRINAMERLRMAAEATRPFGTRVVSGGRFEVEIATLYNSTMHKRMGGVRADYSDDSSPAAPIIFMDNPQDLRTIAAALIAAADWMEEEIK